MRNLKLVLVACVFLLAGCKEEGTEIIPGNPLVHYIDGSIVANMMPVVDPDSIPNRVRSRFRVLLVNLGSEDLKSLSIPAADVILVATGEKVGTFGVRTDWDGTLGPGQSKVLTFAKRDSTENFSRIPCGQTVTLSITLLQKGAPLSSASSPDYPFLCLQ